MRAAAAGLALLLLAGRAMAGETATIPLPGLPSGARLALCGDSITEQRLYTVAVEAYLLAGAGRADVSVHQFGWAGENADQFRHRIRRGDLDPFRPTAACLAYGANDAGGMAWEAWMEPMWRQRLTALVAALRQRHPATAGSIVVCSPTFLQAPADGTGGERSAAFNQSLERFRGIGLEVARDAGVAFADLRERMRQGGTAAGAALGPAFRWGGRDGVHPGPNGQLMIAHEVLLALGCHGPVADLRLDLGGGGTAAGDGHELIADGAGRWRVRSRRWPLRCAALGPADGEAAATILPYLPFQRELNRFGLTVTGLTAEAAEVAWDGETRRFTRAELAAGVDLAEAFPRTPFDAPSAGLVAAIVRRQAHETALIKAAGAATAPRSGWTEAGVAERERLDREVHALLVPVEHRLAIAPAR